MRDLGTGFVPTGYKVMWRVPHSERGSALEKINVIGERQREKEGSTENAVTFAAYWPGPLLLGARFRRQPLAPSGATTRVLGVDRSARPSRGACRAINAELRLLKRRKRRNVDREKPLDSRGLI